MEKEFRQNYLTWVNNVILRRLELLNKPINARHGTPPSAFTISVALEVINSTGHCHCL